MRGGSVEILDVFAIALITDWSEAFAHDRFGETGDGIERIANVVTYLGHEFRFCRRHAFGLRLGAAGFFGGGV